MIRVLGTTGRTNGWNLLNRELENVATITRDADGGYVITPIPTAYVGE